MTNYKMTNEELRNKMNEIKPHTNWARKIYNRARAFGVIKNEGSYLKLFAINE